MDDEINREIAEIVAEDQQQDNEMEIHEEEDEGMQEIPPNLIAIAQQMGVDLDPEQLAQIK